MRWLAALLLTAGAVQAAVVSPRADSVGVTIYHEGEVSAEQLRDSGRNDGLSMIRESRTVDLPEGDSEIQFRGVASTMVPETAALDGLPETPGERNFDYGLLSPASLLEKSVGETVHLVRTDRKTGKVSDEPAVVLSGPDGTVLKTQAGYQAPGCNTVPEHLVFDHLPDGLIDRPTLSVKVHVAKAGRYQLALRYVATGLNWAAAYVARVNPDGATLNLSGWLTLANFGETGFSAADVDVIAGRANTTGEDQPPGIPQHMVQPNCWVKNPLWYRAMLGFAAPPPPPAPMMALMGTPLRKADMLDQVSVSASRLVEARNFGDYKQYPLGEATDMAAQQTKQIQFLEQPTVPFARIYGARGEAGGFGEADVTLPATIFLRAKNTEESGIGKALPAGDIATLEGTEAMLTGQGQVDDTPVGLPLEIPAGQTANVTAQVRRVAMRKFDKLRKHTEADQEVIITNGNATPALFEWRQPLGLGDSIAGESQRHGELHGDALWSLALKPGEQRVIRYTINSPG
jgi:hypothetical protein